MEEEKKIISRKEAKEAGLKFYFTGKPCKHGHVADRITSTKACYGCHCIKAKIKRDQHPEYFKEYYQKNKDKKLEYSHRWWKENLGRMREWRKIYRENNRANHNAKAARYRVKKLQQQPIWANIEIIKEFYISARELTIITGIEYHVDHYYPLQGKTVCGLHTEFNLHIITEHENKKKANKTPQEFYGVTDE